jgi:tetratricopeptide (TPR) repeat protein
MPKSILLHCILSILLATKGVSQEIDTLVDIGGAKMHFHIIKGKGIPILFEAGGGNDGTVWNRLLKPLSEITGTTLITYDRMGLGKSDPDTSKFWITKGVEAMETGLQKLGYNKDIILVSHSLGGFYSTLYAVRHSQNVKAAVFIDANHIGFFTDEHVTKMLASSDTSQMQQLKDAVFVNMIRLMRKTSFPTSIPAIDIVSERTSFEGTIDAERWKDVHAAFVNASKNRQSIIAYESGHYVFLFNPELIINAVVKAYTNSIDEKHAFQILKRANDYALISSNDIRKRYGKYIHSENDLNEWGYGMLKKGNIHHALEVFKLNVILHPASANVYDSLADAYERSGDKTLAIQYYRKCLEIDSSKTHAQKRLSFLTEKPIR